MSAGKKVRESWIRVKCIALERLDGNYAKFEEALRLIHKFFPESRSLFSTVSQISIWSFIESMKFSDWYQDFSCDPWQTPKGPDLGLAAKGGFLGTPYVVYNRLIQHTGYYPSGRCVVILDVILERGWTKSIEVPIICDCSKVGDRLNEINSRELFSAASYDSLFVFESGEAMVVDHDNRFYWAKSRKNY